MRSIFASILFSALICTTLALQKLKDLTDVLEANSDVSQFTSLLTSSAFGDLYANVSFQQGITILVPNDDAFSKIQNSQIGDAFKYNRTDAIRAILQYHIIPGIHRSGSYNGSFQFNPTWLDNPKYDNVTGGQVVGGVLQSGDLNIFTSGYGSRSTVMETDIAFKGGIMHTIDTFLIPPVDFTRTCSAFNLTAAGGAFANASLAPFIDTADDITIFAPNNLAFQNLGTALSNLTTGQLSDLLQYHIVHRVRYSNSLLNDTVLHTREGNSLTVTFASNSYFVNSARVLQQDILLANGVLHVLDNVLSPNASHARPVPTLRSQPPIIAGTRLPHNAVPFVSYLTTTTSSSAAASVSANANATSSGLDAAAAATTSSSSTAGSSSTTATGAKKSKGAAAGGRWQGERRAAVLGAAVWVVGFL